MQVAADQVFTWPHGAEMPALTPLVEDTETKSEGDEEQAEETDGEVLKRDVVQVSSWARFGCVGIRSDDYA